MSKSDSSNQSGETMQPTPAQSTALMLAGNPVAMWIYDVSTLRLLEVSDGAVEQYGYTRDELLNMTTSDLLPVAELSGSVAPPRDYLDRKPLTTHIRKDGTPLLIRLCSNDLTYNGKAARLVVACDVTERITLHHELTQRALSDAATGLPSMRLLEERAAEAFEHADRSKRRVAVVRLDLDQFEEVNLRFGRGAGDACLRQVASWLTRRVRGMDTVARNVGKEFTVILAELDDDYDLYRVATALMKIFAEPISVEGLSVQLSASLGIAVYPDDGRSFEHLNRAAEVALQRAKQAGGRRISMFSLEGTERTELDVYMRETLRQKNFQLHYQPQYAPDGTIRALEALLRLPGKDSGFVPPDRFIPIAEATGMIEPLGLWVIEEASRQMHAWQEQYGQTSRIAVNVSPLQLHSANFAADAIAIMKASAIDPDWLEFEITERAVLNFEDVVEPMRHLAAVGITFAVDDFGTGYSSLQHLHRLPISVLKIDRSFIQRIDEPRGTEAIVQAIVSMAHSLGMSVVAEGIETESQRSLAVQMGCDAIQGFLHSTPVLAEEVPALMGWV